MRGTIAKNLDREVKKGKIEEKDKSKIIGRIQATTDLTEIARADFAVEAVPEGKKKRNFVIVIGAAEKRFGLLVDSLVGEEELVIKALPTEIISSDLVSGASILGDGTVVLILNVPAVLARLSRATPLGAIA